MPRVESIDLGQALHTPAPQGGAEVLVHLEDGSVSTLGVATPADPGSWLGARGRKGHFGSPILFVASLSRAVLERAVAAMAGEMGGYWLRYYNRARRPSALSPRGVRVASAAVSELWPPRSSSAAAPGHGCGPPASRAVSGREGCAVVQAYASDCREFSLLAATPSWFEKTFNGHGLDYYYGPAVLFVRSLDVALVRRVVRGMASEGDRWLCLYDTPRTTLPQVLARFKETH